MNEIWKDIEEYERLCKLTLNNTNLENNTDLIK